MADNKKLGELPKKPKAGIPRSKAALTSLLALAICLAVPPTSYAAKDRLFNVPSDVLFESAVKIAARDYKLDYANSEKLTFTFRTGASAASFGLNVTAVVQQLGPNQSRLALDMKNADSRQMFSWGAGGRVADQFFKSVEDDLQSNYPVKFEVELTKPVGATGLSFEDNFIGIAFSVERTSLAFAFRNKTDNPIKIDWNQWSYVDTGSASHKIIHKDTVFNSRDNQSPSTVPPTAGISDFVVPSENWQPSPVHGGLVTSELLASGAGSSAFVGRTFSLFMPIEVSGTTKNYFFTFTIKGVHKLN